MCRSCAKLSSFRLSSKSSSSSLSSKSSSSSLSFKSSSSCPSKQLSKQKLEITEVLDLIAGAKKFELKWFQEISIIGHTGFAVVINNKNVILFDYGKVEEENEQSRGKGDSAMTTTPIEAFKIKTYYYDVYSINSDLDPNFTKKLVVMIKQLSKVFVNKPYDIYKSNCRHHVIECMETAKEILVSIVSNKEDCINKFDIAIAKIQEILKNDESKIEKMLHVPILGKIIEDFSKMASGQKDEVTEASEMAFIVC